LARRKEKLSKIINEAKIKNPIIKVIREFLEHRALWMYLLCDEARKRGLPPESFAPEAIRRCGLYHGKNINEKVNTNSLKTLRKKLFTKRVQWIFEMKIKKSTEDSLHVDFHYCPLVKAWQKQGCSDEEIGKLCDFAMYGDRGIAEIFNCELHLPKTIAKGDDLCEIRFERKREAKNPTLDKYRYFHGILKRINKGVY
jgi:hypothetical protein